MKNFKIIVTGAALVVLVLAACATRVEANETVVRERIESEAATFRVVRVVSGLENPWAVAFLPDGRKLITERAGRLNVLENGELTRITGLPTITPGGQGGLLDVALHPAYEQTGWIYFSYAAPTRTGRGTHLARARLSSTALTDLEILFEMDPGTTRGQHFGSRIVFDRDGYLYLTIGDRGEMNRAQDIMDHAGTTIRLHDDGRVPSDNPFAGRNDALPEIYTYGNRNAQGMALHPETGVVWQNEHGPQGGDEINIIRSGLNYGWPVVTHGEQYGGGTIGVGEEAPGMEPPVIDWTPSIAPSGMTFYTGSNFPGWNGDIFVGALAGQHLRRVVLDGDQVVHQESLLQGTIGRIRDVRTGPDGNLWLLTDARNGGLYRLEPAR